MASPAEAGVLKKIMIRTVNMKIAMTKRQLTLNMLRKLRSKKIGNTVEHFPTGKPQGEVLRGIERGRRPLISS